MTPLVTSYQSKLNTMIYRTGKLQTLALLVFLSCDVAAQHSDPKRVAAVNGQPISEDEVLAAAAADLAKLDARRAQFDLEIKRERESALQAALDRLFKDRVLAAEAARRKISVDELLEIEVNRYVPAPTDEALVQFYNANKSWMEGSLGDNVASIRKDLTDEKREAILGAFVTRLKDVYGAVSFTEPMRILIPTAGRPSKGPADAPVTLVEFSDFECPFCRALSPTLQRISSTYKDKVRIVYMQFPLADMHPRALKAAEASLCALDQDKFWPLHDAMFGDPSNLRPEELKKKAANLSLEMNLLNTCLDSGKNFGREREDVEEGVKAGVSGTPALFINGRPLVGNQPYGEIQEVIEDELRRAGQ